MNMNKKPLILAVDDIPVNTTLLKSQLRFSNYDIITASNGKEALEKIASDHPDAVLLDIMMPEMDGVDTTRRIRALGGKYEKLTIIALSANVISEAKTLFLEEGMQDILCKPIEMKALDEIINKWLPVE